LTAAVDGLGEHVATVPCSSRGALVGMVPPSDGAADEPVGEEDCLMRALSGSITGRGDALGAIGACEALLVEVFKEPEQRLQAKGILSRASRAIGRLAGNATSLEVAARGLHVRHLDVLDELRFCRADLGTALSSAETALAAVQQMLKEAFLLRRAERERLMHECEGRLEATGAEHDDAVERLAAAAEAREAALHAALEAARVQAASREAEQKAEIVKLKSALEAQAARQLEATRTLHTDLAAALHAKGILEDKLAECREKLLRAIAGEATERDALAAWPAANHRRHK